MFYNNDSNYITMLNFKGKEIIIERIQVNATVYKIPTLVDCLFRKITLFALLYGWFLMNKLLKRERTVFIP